MSDFRLTGLIQPGVTVEWSMAPCGGRHTQPQCVSASAKWPDDSSAVVNLDLELVQRGLSPTPRFSYGSVYNRTALRIDTFRSLPEFAEAVRALSLQRPR